MIRRGSGQKVNRAKNAGVLPVERQCISLDTASDDKRALGAVLGIDGGMQRAPRLIPGLLRRLFYTCLELRRSALPGDASPGGELCAHNDAQS